MSSKAPSKWKESPDQFHSCWSAGTDGWTDTHVWTRRTHSFLSCSGTCTVLLGGEFRSDQKLHPAGVNGYIHLTRHTTFSVLSYSSCYTEGIRSQWPHGMEPLLSSWNQGFCKMHYQLIPILGITGRKQTTLARFWGFWAVCQCRDLQTTNFGCVGQDGMQAEQKASSSSLVCSICVGLLFLGRFFIL